MITSLEKLQLDKKNSTLELISAINNQKSTIFDNMENSLAEKFSYEWFIEYFVKIGHSEETAKRLALKFSKKN